LNTSFSSIGNTDGARRTQLCTITCAIFEFHTISFVKCSLDCETKHALRFTN
jgi:hypothetical protein